MSSSMNDNEKNDDFKKSNSCVTDSAKNLNNAMHGLDNSILKIGNNNESLISRLKTEIESILEKKFGLNFIAVMNFHMKIKLDVEEPYEVLWCEPHAFYEKLKELFGEEGTSLIFIVIGEELVRSGLIERQREIIDLMRVRDYEAKCKLQNIWQKLTAKS